ncbi:hypothetical protein PAHAL_6G022200 [Panicum hallii]|uniref:Uncharacterized protein n=1 Tax=Panicum hallii TaxID=206008 RepID=A0A2T8IEW3_9POAL|nr:hypothetical protein PAHAL_6G022200 [Panicum hallii]
MTGAEPSGSPSSRTTGVEFLSPPPLLPTRRRFPRDRQALHFLAASPSSPPLGAGASSSSFIRRTPPPPSAVRQPARCR